MEQHAPNSKIGLYVRAIGESMTDAKVSRVLFQQDAAKENPGPIPLRIYLKAFMYSIKEILDLVNSKQIQSNPLMATQFQSLRQVVETSPILNYLARARNSMSHDPAGPMTTQGGWVKVVPPERNPDGSFNLATRWDHLPGNIKLGTVKRRGFPDTPVPHPDLDEFNNFEIGQMMDASINEIEPLILELEVSIE